MTTINTRLLFLTLSFVLLVLFPLLINSVTNAKDKQIINNNKLLFDKAKFNPQTAFEHVHKQVSFGARPSGSEANKKTRIYIEIKLKEFGLKVTRDKFIAHTPSTKFPVIEMENIIAELPGKTNDVIIIASHYDTKYFEDINFLGANDGGSSTGTLLEIARVLNLTKTQNNKLPHTVWFIFFDGEESIIDWSIENDHTYGSRHLVNRLKTSGELSRIKAMILLDMVGDKDLTIHRECFSTDWLSEVIANTAKKLNYAKYFPSNVMNCIEDDHIPFLQENIPAIDLIDFTYGGQLNPYWHTAEDTLDKISPDSLNIVGNTVLKSLRTISSKIK